MPPSQSTTPSITKQRVGHRRAVVRCPSNILRQEHHRLLANGWCTRPRALDCSFEAICEGCGHFSTGVEFIPVLARQRDHAGAHGQPRREAIYQRLLDRIDGTRS